MIRDLRERLRESYPGRHRAGWCHAYRTGGKLFVVYATITVDKARPRVRPEKVLAEIRTYADTIDVAEEMALAALAALAAVEAQ